jgi:lysophospholipase L1-like esterase
MAARTAAIGGSLLLGVVLVAVGLANGQPPAIPPGLDAKAAAATSINTTPAPTTPASTTPGAAPPPATAAANPAIPRITLIGDSVMVGAANALQQALGPVRIDAAVSRQFGTAIDILSAIKASGQLSDTVVVHMGTNGVITQGHMDAIMSILKDRKRVVFVNLKVPRRWEQIDNDVLAANVAKYPNMKLIDWHTIGDAHPEYFYEDGIHLNPTGQRAYAALIQQATAPNP